MSVSKVMEPGYVLKPASLRNNCFLRTYVSCHKAGTQRLKSSRPSKCLLKPKANTGTDSWGKNRGSKQSSGKVCEGRNQKKGEGKGAKERGEEEKPPMSTGEMACPLKGKQAE